MGGLADRIRYALANPLRDDHAIDPMRELANLLREFGLEPESGGAAVTFAGRDPIVSSPLTFATMTVGCAYGEGRVGGGATAVPGRPKSGSYSQPRQGPTSAMSFLRQEIRCKTRAAHT